MSEWKQYRRTNTAEMRPYVPGEDMTGISVSDQDDPPNDHGMVARNPKNHADQWYVARAYFEDNLEPAQPDHPEAGEVDEALAAIEKAREKLSALCAGDERWVMSIPAQPDSDPDLVIADALSKARRALQQRQGERVPDNVISKYEELLLAVVKKHPGETRHETALRYIQQAENRPAHCASAPEPDSGEKQ